MDQSIRALQAQYLKTHLEQKLKETGGATPRDEICDLGWIHGYDCFEPGLSIYHEKAKSILKQCSRSGIELVVDDISNLTRKIEIFKTTVKLNHSIFWIRNPTGHSPIQIAEFITGNWKSGQFGVNLKRFKTSLDRTHPNVKIKSLGSDWYTGIQKESCLILNKMDLPELRAWGVNEACNLPSPRQPETSQWSCFGHATNNISKRYKPDTTKALFAKKTWQLLYQTKAFAAFTEIFSFAWVLCNESFCGFTQKYWSVMDVRRLLLESIKNSNTIEFECDIAKLPPLETVLNEKDNAYLFDRSLRPDREMNVSVFHSILPCPPGHEIDQGT